MKRVDREAKLIIIRDTMTDIEKTPLYDVHAARGARFVPFAGFEMPVQFAGVIAEHKAVREAAGLFDVSHMGEIILEGGDALSGLQNIVTNDISKLEDGQALYTVMCRDDGGIVDDLIVYREAVDRYFLCVNASRRDVDFDHIVSHLRGMDVAAFDASEDYAQIAFQGPKALEILARVTEAKVLEMKPFTWVDATVAGVEEVRIARTGYTGEDGVELYLAPEGAAQVWEALEEAGKSDGVVPCGLGARDTLRLEMKYALYGNDIDENRNPYEAGLGWVVKLAKGDFIGKAALEKVKADKPAQKLVGFKLEGRGIPRQGYEIAVEGETVGVVTSGTHSPSLGEAIGVGYVPRSLSKAGSKFDVLVRGKPVPAVVVKTPFYKRDEA